jgi:hypothetical protein
MARFHNGNSYTITTKLLGSEWVVPPGGEINIPDSIAFVVKKRGLPLTEGPSPNKAVASVKVPEPVKEAISMDSMPLDDEPEGVEAVAKAKADLLAKGALPKGK